MEPQPPVIRRPDWFQRNWKWFVPGLVLTILLVIAVFAAGVITLVTKLMTSSGAYQQAMTLVQEDPRAGALLGEPVERRGWLIMGNINVSGGGGYASIAIPVKGPKAKGTLYVEARKRAGEWELREVILKLKATGERVWLVGGVEQVSGGREFGSSGKNTPT